jgi:hypothetical protein
MSIITQRPHTAAEIAAAKARAIASVEKAAAGKHETASADLPMVHGRKLREAHEAIDDPAPTAEVYKLLSTMIVGPASKEAFDAAARSVIDQENAWAAAAKDIEATKGSAIAAINAANTVDGVNAVIANIQWPQ